MRMERTPYDMIGGEAGVKALVDRFYDRMESDPGAAAVRAMHAPDLTPMRQRLFEFLSGWFGGPPLYYDRPDAKCIMHAHAPFAIGEAERDAWLACMSAALDEAGLAVNERKLFDDAFYRMADAMRRR